MPRAVLLTTLGLAAVAGVLGFMLGRQQVTLDSTQVIEAVAQRHVAAHGGALTDCVGLPGEGSAVFYVRCGATLYAVDSWGRISRVLEDGI